MRTVRARPRLATERDAHNYILTAVRTTAFQLFEQRRRWQLLGDSEPAEMPDVASDPLRTMLAGEAREAESALTQRALSALQELDPMRRQVVELLVLREPPLKLREVSAIQGAPISTVHSMLQAALRELGRSLRQEED